MAVKCNIAEIVYNKYHLKQWGFEVNKVFNKRFIQSYVESLACSDISLKLCGVDETTGSTADENTDATTTIVNCNLNVIGMSFTINTNPELPEEISFYLGVGDIYGAKQPISYNWIYDVDTFELVGDATQPIVKFKLKSGKKVDLVVTPISLQITDANGCTDTKVCYYTSTGMKCNNSYQPCYPDTNLNVVYNYVACSKPKNLVVNS